MDCPAWGTPVEFCKTGSALADKEGTVCSGCYAAKGTFRFRQTQDKLRRSITNIFHELWVPALIQQIEWYGHERFRWFHSGDLQGVNHLRNIIRVCLETPHVMHWMPTREPNIVRQVDEIPSNLTIRASGNRIDGPPPKWWPLTSRVVTEPSPDLCPTSAEGGTCTEHGCNRCWDPGVENVDYMKH